MAENVVVAIGTSTGVKDVDLALRGAELPVLDEGMTDLQELLHRRRSET